MGLQPPLVGLTDIITRGALPPRTPHYGPPAPTIESDPLFMGEIGQWGPEAHSGGS